MIRVGPRVDRNIAPNNSQKFRVMLKRKNIADGEYRSHIIIEALLPPLTDDAQGVYVRPDIKYSIAVIVRKGQLGAHIDITGVKITTGQNDDKTAQLTITFSRSGQRSVFGNLKAYLKSQPAQLLLETNRIGIYPEISLRQLTLPLKGKQPTAGILVIEFAEDPQYGGDLTAKYELLLFGD